MEEVSFSSKVRRLREDLDYSPYAVLPDRETEEGFSLAEGFIDSMKDILKTNR